MWQRRLQNIFIRSDALWWENWGRSREGWKRNDERDIKGDEYNIIHNRRWNTFSSPIMLHFHPYSFVLIGGTKFLLVVTKLGVSTWECQLYNLKKWFDLQKKRRKCPMSTFWMPTLKFQEMIGHAKKKNMSYVLKRIVFRPSVCILIVQMFNSILKRNKLSNSVCWRTFIMTTIA